MAKETALGKRNEGGNEYKWKTLCFYHKLCNF